MSVTNRKGFTLVELSLSIVFIAILSIAIVLIITNAVAAYHRGLTLDRINTGGRDLVDDIRGAVQNSPALLSGESHLFNSTDGKVTKVYSGNNIEDGVVIAINRRRDEGEPWYGAFCTGTYSYVWNAGYVFSDADLEGQGAKLVYSKNGSSHEMTGKLLKVMDRSRTVCETAVTSGAVGYYEGEDSFLFNVGEVDDEPIDILGSYETNFALYDLSVSPPASNKKSSFYLVSFILGTVQSGINVVSSGDYCVTPEGYNSEVENFDYCAINKFSFSAQAIGG